MKQSLEKIDTKLIMIRHYYWVDLLRFLMAFLVLISHYRMAFFVNYEFLPLNQQNIFTALAYLFTRLGEESVLIFFVLSGFLIGGKSIEKILANEVDISSYLVDRFVRIMLPLFASVILVVIINLFLGYKIPYIDLFGTLLSLQGIFTSFSYNPPLWSLSYEVWFYLLMGSIMVLCRVQNKVLIILSYFFLTIIFLIFIINLTPKYLFFWLMGAFAYFLPKSARPSSNTPVYFAFFICSIAFTQITSQSNSANLVLSFINRESAFTVLAFSTCLFIHNIVGCVPVNKLSIKIDKTGSKLSKFSYTLYLTHSPLIPLLSYFGFSKSRSVDLQSISLYVIEIIFAVIVAYLVYLSSEKHTNLVKKILKARIQDSVILSALSTPKVLK
jgi:peptidoglycan/LPS O-acetylase OafA/YrhL